MPTFLFAYHGGSTPRNAEAQAAALDAWNVWLDGIEEAMLDLGNPVADTRVVAADGTVSAPPASPVSGYSIIEAEDMDSALEMARGCPVLAEGGSVEIGELIELADFDDEEEEEEEDENEEDDEDEDDEDGEDES